MSSYNRVILVGNLTRDPELGTFDGGGAVCNFGIAVNEKYKDRDGNNQERVCFVDVEMWNRQAEVASEYLIKGRRILVEGSLKYDTWETDDQQKRSKHSIRANSFRFMGGREEEGGNGTSESTGQSNSGGGTPYSGGGSERGGGASSQPTTQGTSDDDIPF